MVSLVASSAVLAEDNAGEFLGMEQSLFYLCLAVTLTWLCYFVYLFLLNRQINDLKRRLRARDNVKQG